MIHWKFFIWKWNVYFGMIIFHCDLYGLVLSILPLIKLSKDGNIFSYFFVTSHLHKFFFFNRKFIRVRSRARCRYLYSMVKRIGYKPNKEIVECPERYRAGKESLKVLYFLPSTRLFSASSRAQTRSNSFVKFWRRWIKSSVELS